MRKVTKRPMATGLYSKEWSLCACDNNIPSTPQLWTVRKGGKKEAITQKKYILSSV